LAEAAAGVITTKYSSPETTVPKDSSGMAGAAILPSGGNYAPGSAGYFRYNTTSQHVEYFDGTGYQTMVNRSGDTLTGTLTFSGSITQILANNILKLQGSGSTTTHSFLDGTGSEIARFENGRAAWINSVPGGSAGWNVALSGGGDVGLRENATGSAQLISTSTAIIFGGNNGSQPFLFQDGAGVDIAAINVSGTYVVLSDENFKQNITDCPYGLSELMLLKPKAYEVVSEAIQVAEHFGDDATVPTRLGLLAQDVNSVIPEVVSEGLGETGHMFLDYTSLIPVLINAIKELKQEFDDYVNSHP
jgi:hypothetical protein